ncbi:MAG TPA: hypothetical protein H9898_09005 [Candidatus Anaerobiospirillum stercoravium]|nr:hypothetical protein [Candidatus Anaerobiospirillum stercoravium]
MPKPVTTIMPARWRGRKARAAQRSAPSSQALGKARLKRALARERTSATAQSTAASAAAAASASAPERAAPGAPAYPIVPVVVATKEELAAATQRKAKRIVVTGELASKLETSFKGLRNLSASSLNTLALVLSGAALFAPFTGGVSLGAAGTVMGTVGAALTASAIAAISAIGVALVVAVFKGYDEVKLSGGGIELVLRSGKHQAPRGTEESSAEESSAEGGERR